MTSIPVTLFDSTSGMGFMEVFHGLSKVTGAVPAIWKFKDANNNPAKGREQMKNTKICLEQKKEIEKLFGMAAKISQRPNFH